MFFCVFFFFFFFFFFVPRLFEEKRGGHSIWLSVVHYAWFRDCIRYLVGRPTTKYFMTENLNFATNN